MLVGVAGLPKPVPSESGALLQAAAEKGYAAELASAFAAQTTAGRTLAAALRKVHLNLRLTEESLEVLKKKLASPQSVFSRLVAATGSAELGQLIRSDVRALTAKSLTRASPLAVVLSAASLPALHKSLTPQELAVLVKGLSAQGAVTTGAQDMLMADLRQFVTAVTPEARTTAATQFVAHAGSLITGPAAKLLKAAGTALAPSG